MMRSTQLDLQSRSLSTPSIQLDQLIPIYPCVRASNRCARVGFPVLRRARCGGRRRRLGNPVLPPCDRDDHGVRRPADARLLQGKARLPCGLFRAPTQRCWRIRAHGHAPLTPSIMSHVYIDKTAESNAGQRGRLFARQEAHTATWMGRSSAKCCGSLRWARRGFLFFNFRRSKL